MGLRHAGHMYLIYILLELRTALSVEKFPFHNPSLEIMRRYWTVSELLSSALNFKVSALD